MIPRQPAFVFALALLAGTAMADKVAKPSKAASAASAASATYDPMSKQCEDMQKIMAIKDPAKRQKAMDEHRKTMHDTNQGCDMMDGGMRSGMGMGASSPGGHMRPGMGQ